MVAIKDAIKILLKSQVFIRTEKLQAVALSLDSFFVYLFVRLVRKLFFKTLLLLQS